LALVGVRQLLVPVTTGLADNTDFARVLFWYGLGHRADGVAEPVFDYVDPRFERVAGQAPLQLGYPSSELAFLTLARGGALLLGDDGLDVRASGVAHGIGWLLAWLLLLLATRPLRPVPRWTFLGVYALMTADAAYLATFNSFYSEAAALVFLPATLAAGLHLHATGGRRAALLLAAAGFGLVSAKPQYAVVGVVLAALLLVRPDRSAATVAAAVALVALPVSAYLVLPASLREANVYNSVFTGVLPHATDPAAAAADLGIPPELAARSGTDFYSTRALEDPALRDDFFGEVDHLAVVAHLGTSPRTLARLVGAAAGRMVELRPENLGTATADRGLPPGAQPGWYEAYSDGRRALAGVSAPLVLGVLAAGIAVPAAALARLPAGSRATSLPALVLAVAVAAWVSLGTVLVGDGLFELVKKLLLANALLDVVVAAGLAAAAGALVGSAGTTAAAQREDAPPAARVGAGHPAGHPAGHH